MAKVEVKTEWLEEYDKSLEESCKVDDEISNKTYKQEDSFPGYSLELCPVDLPEAKVSNYSEVEKMEFEFCKIENDPWDEQFYKEETSETEEYESTYEPHNQLHKEHELDSFINPEQQQEEIDLVSDEDDEILIVSTSDGLLQKQASHPSKIISEKKEKKSYSCATCGQTFSKNTEFTNHILGHILENSVESNTGNEVTSQDDVNRNMLDRNLHPNLKRFKIERLQWGQSRHTVSVPAESDKPYKCFSCKKSFCKFSELKDHVGSRGDNTSYTCDKCNLTFAVRCLLDQHMYMHKRTYACKFCKREFTYLKKFKYHVNAHCKEFFCKVCSKGFKSDKTYKRHVLAHINKKL